MRSLIALPHQPFTDPLTYCEEEEEEEGCWCVCCLLLCFHDPGFSQLSFRRIRHACFIGGWDRQDRQRQRRRWFTGVCGGVREGGMDGVVLWWVGRGRVGTGEGVEGGGKVHIGITPWGLFF